MRAPVFIIRPTREVSNAELDQFLTVYGDRLKQHGRPYATVLDLRFFRDMPPMQRKRITDTMHSKGHTADCRGCALVFDSAVLRMLLTAILWAAKPAYDVRVFSDLNAALVWARTQVRDDDTPLVQVGSG